MRDDLTKMKKETDDISKLVKELEAAVTELERRVLHINDPTGEEKEEYEQQQSNIDDGRINLETYENNLRQIGKRRHAQATIRPAGLPCSQRYIRFSHLSCFWRGYLLRK